MIVECSVCNTKNRVPDEPSSKGKYRCGSCGGTLELRSKGDLEETETTGTASQEFGVSHGFADDRLSRGATLFEGAEFCTPNAERRISVKRLLGVTLFGCLLTGYATKACDFTVPTILSIVQHIDREAATEQYLSSVALIFLAFGFSALVGSGVAAFLSRRYAFRAGLLANLPFAVLFLRNLAVSIVKRHDWLVGNLSYQLYSFLLFCIVVVASVLGAIAGRILYTQALDYDLDRDKATIFGIRWGHYFWILPFVVYPYLSTLVMATYAGVLAVLADYYVAFHPSLWFSLGWMANAILNPLAVWFAFGIMLGGFGRFLAVMRYGQSAVRAVGRFGRAILYGLLFPMLSSSIAGISASFTNALPKPAPGHWKIMLGIASLLIVVWLVVQLWSRISNRMSALK